MRKTLFAIGAATGLVVVFFLARAVAFAATGFDPDQASLDSDCDQCTLTETLDVLPWIALACLAYLIVVALIAAVFLRRQRQRSRTPDDAVRSKHP